MSEPSPFNIEEKSIKKTIRTNSDNILSICVLKDSRIATSTFGEIVIILNELLININIFHLLYIMNN